MVRKPAPAVASGDWHLKSRSSDDERAIMDELRRFETEQRAALVRQRAGALLPIPIRSTLRGRSGPRPRCWSAD